MEVEFWGWRGGERIEEALPIIRKRDIVGRSCGWKPSKRQTGSADYYYYYYYY